MSYSERTQAELCSFKKQAWLNLIEKYSPRDGKLEVLDIGTGPGFFPIILAEVGHKTVGIDCAEEMLKNARSKANEEGVTPEFIKMDCHKLDFKDDHFDLIICRNLTWTLENPKTAYSEWLRVLKPGGRLLVFDANWYLRLFDDEVKRLYEEDIQNVIELGLKNPHEGADIEASEKIGIKLPLSKLYRPKWDLEVLKSLGFSSVFFENDISSLVWDEAEKITFRATPMFLVGAQK